MIKLTDSDMLRRLDIIYAKLMKNQHMTFHDAEKEYLEEEISNKLAGKGRITEEPGILTAMHNHMVYMSTELDMAKAEISTIRATLSAHSDKHTIYFGKFQSTGDLLDDLYRTVPRHSFTGYMQLDSILDAYAIRNKITTIKQ